MTDLLSVEDIKKALGAFAGEQRAPTPSPVLYPHPPPWPLPLSLRASCRGRRGAEGGGASSGRDLGRWGSRAPCPGHRKLGAAKGWVALLGGLESPPRSKTGVLGPGLPL